VYTHKGVLHTFLFKERGETEQGSVCRNNIILHFVVKSCHIVQEMIFYATHSRLSNKFWEELMAPTFVQTSGPTQ
jgi:hypothetical protein